MKKQDLLKLFDDDLLDKLFGFCYARTNDSYEAEELCSDIVYAIVKAAHSGGEVENAYPFLWQVAHNVYADFSDQRKRRADAACEGDPEEILREIPEADFSEDTEDRLTAVYRRIAFLTRAYREVMILFYIDGLSTAQIAGMQKISEGTVRQRLFSARKKIRSEVKNMEKVNPKPVALDKIDFVIHGTGDPHWGDPREGFDRLFSKHIVWLCHKKPRTASEIAEELNVPTMYVEEELELLCKGSNGKYGLLRRLENGRYGINFILFDPNMFEKVTALYTEQLPKICDTISAFVEEHKADYLAFPYLNRKVDMNLILWQQVYGIARQFEDCVESALKKTYFSDVVPTKRPFSVSGYVYTGKSYDCGWDGVAAQNVCGFSQVHLDNIYLTRIKAHFHCGLNVSTDPQIQLALRAIDGLDITALSEDEKEHAAKAVACGYLYRDGDMLYTKILTCTLEDRGHLFAITNQLQEGYFDEDAEIVAGKLAAFIRKSVPDYLLGEWRLANMIAGTPVIDAVIECLIEKGVLIPPEDGIGAEGCWMYVGK